MFQQINNLAGKSICLDGVAIFFAKYFGYILVAILFLLLAKDWKKPRRKAFGFLRGRYWQMVVLAFGSAIISKFIITEILRWLWFRPRPFVEHRVNLLLNQSAAEASFPSGHAAFYFALSTIIYFYNKKLGIGFFIASFLISISRIFCGIHLPSDILAGMLVGIITGLLVFKIFQKIYQKK